MTDEVTNDALALGTTDAPAADAASDVASPPDASPLVQEDAPPVEDVPVLDLSKGASLPTSDGIEADQIEVTAAVESEKKAYIVWDALNLVLVAGPFASAEDAQIDVDYRSAKASRAANYVAPVYSIEAVSDLNA